ncbi:MAG: GNAT family N-acetyltransferase [Thermoplasmata archaeon]
MRILDLKALSPSLRYQLPVVGVLDGDPPWGYEFVRMSRKLRIPHADYHAVYAVESGEIQSHVGVLWLTFTTPTGAVPVTGIDNVATRPTAERRGWAAALMEEVHRRESDRGVAWAFLWTHRSWGAHRLYERLGYRDVYSPPAALKRLARNRRARLPVGYEWRPAALRDANRLDRIFRRATVGRLGFISRFPGSFRARFVLGWRRPENHRILFHHSREVGYANLAVSDTWSVTANEVIVVDPSHTDAMIQALETSTSNKWLLLETTTFVTDGATQLRKRGFSLHPATHRTLMAKSLQGPGRESAEVVRTIGSPRFSNHRGDMF